MTSISTDTVAKITELSQRMQLKANYISSPEHTADDLFQIMVEAIIVESEKKPEFIQQTDAYIVNFAVWTAKKKAQASRTYGKYVGEEKVFKTEEDDEASDFDTQTDPSLSPEELVVRREVYRDIEKVIRTLSTENRKVVVMLFERYSQVEIAEALGITKAAVTQRKATIAKTLGFELVTA